MTLVPCPRMAETHSPYVSEFDYVPRFHPSRNPDCPSRFVHRDQFQEDFSDWNRPSIEVRAVLTSCTRFEGERFDTFGDFFGARLERSYNARQDQGSINNCTKRVVISMRFNNIGKTSTQEKFVVVDHVLDSATMRKIPLRNPYVIKVRQETVLQLYGLKFQSVVNAEAREEVINNENPNYTGCDVGLENPTCGQTFMRGEPVPFSQGFCCSCDPKVNARRQWQESNDRAESFLSVANKPRNRLGTAGASPDGDPMAERQDEARSSTKSTTNDANPNDIQTIGVSAIESRKYLAGESNEVSKSPVTNSGQPAEGSSTFESVGRSPTDGIESNRNVEQKESTRPNEVSVKETGSPKRIIEEDRANEDRSRKDQCFDRDARANDTRSLKFVKGDNRGFRVGRLKPEAQRASGVRRTNVTSSKAREQTRRKKHGPKSVSSEDSKGKGVKKARKSSKKRNKAFVVTSSIDSLAIRPAMHLNEPLKNLSTGVLNSNGPVLGRGWRGAKGSTEGNLNRVMESTSQLPDIIARSFNEKHGADGYFQSNGNEGNKRALSRPLRGDFSLLSELLTSEENVSVEDNSIESDKKLLTKEIIRNYTPQKRTLKNLSCKGTYSRGTRSSKTRGHFGRSRRHIKNGRRSGFVRRRGPRLNNRWKREKVLQGRDERTRKGQNSSGKNVQVYIDDNRLLKSPDKGESRVKESKESSGAVRGKERSGSENKNDLKYQNDGNRQENVDKQIEDKFSRISDALKEDAMGPKMILEKPEGETTEKVEKIQEAPETQYDVKESDETLQQRNEASDSKTSDEAINVLEDKPEEFDGNAPQNRFVSFDQSIKKQNDLDTQGDLQQGSENEKIDEFDKNVPRYNIQNVDKRIESQEKLDLNDDLQHEVLNEDQIGETLLPNSLWSPTSDNKYNVAVINENRGSTSNSELFLSPTETSASGDRNQVTSSSLVAQKAKEIQLDDSSHEENSENLTKATAVQATQALIVIDLFKVVTDSIGTPKETPGPETPSSEAVTLNRPPEKALAPLWEFKPVHRTLEITESTTFHLEESTTVTENVTMTENITTIVETTKITDETFRPSIKPEESAKQTSSGGAEFHQEVVIDETTFPDETEKPMRTNYATVKRVEFVDVDSMLKNTAAVDKKENLGPWVISVGKKKKRTTPSMLKSKDSLIRAKLEDRRDERSLYNDNPGYYGKKDSKEADSNMRFSFEAGNLDLVKEKVGVTSSFLQEQRNYVRLKVDGQSDPEKTNEGCGRLKAKNELKIDDDEDPEKLNESERKRKVSNSDLLRSNWIHHPWYPTTEASEYTVRQKENYGRVSMNKKLPKEAELKGSDVGGRILRPCTRNEDHRMEPKAIVCNARLNRRGRRLMSVQRFKETKPSDNHRSNKDRKIHDEDNYVKDSDDYEDTSEHRKRLKSIHDKDHSKSKKRDANKSRSKKQSRKDNKSRSKKQSIPSSEDTSDDYNYIMPDYEDDGILEQREAEDVNDPEELFEIDETVPSVEDVGKDKGSKVSESLEDGSFNQLVDGSVPDFGESLVENPKIEGQARSIEEKKDEEVGKDFEISLTGKIHLESDSNGRPVSISFNAAPEILRKDGMANGYGNRASSDPETSIIDVPAAGLDDANFFAVQSSLNGPVDPLDRSKEYFPDRIRNRNSENFRNEPSEGRRQRLLHLQKKSVENQLKENPESLKNSLKVKRQYSHEENLKATEKKSETSNLDKGANLVSEELEAEDEELSDVDEDESLNVEDRNRRSMVSDESDFKKTMNDALNDSPQISIDLSESPENSLINVMGDTKNSSENVGSASDPDTGNCYAMNSTIQKLDLPETTTVKEKQGAVANSTLMGFQDYEAYSNTTEPNTLLDKITIVLPGAVAEEAATEYPKYGAAKMSQNTSEYEASKEDKEAIEKKNMMAVADFVKKLENLVSDSGNSTGNDTGRTLIHLKKFIIVPDNRSLFSVKELAGSEKAEETSTTERVILMGEGTVHEDTAKSSTDNKEYLKSPESVVEQKWSTENSDLIKEIISSVMRGDDLKRDASLKKSSDSSEAKSMNGVGAKLADAPLESGLKDWNEKEEVDRVGKLEGSAKLREETSTNVEGSRNAEENTGDQFLESRKDNGVCKGNQFNVKEKRETSVSNAGPVSRKGGGKRQAKRNEKKERRRKKKRKTKKKKKKKGSKRKKDAKKSKSKWPFKRNLLMLPEKEQIQASGGHYGIKRRIPREFSAREGNTNGGTSSRSRGENEFKESQIRGGQDCGDRKHPPNVDPLEYLESTHCLRFSDLWYSVYQLEEPTIDHKVHLQIYQKDNSPDGSVSWKDLTNGTTIRLGTFDRHYRNKEDTMAFTYYDVKFKPTAEYNLDPVKDRLLVPSMLTQKNSQYSESEGWSGEYLVVQADAINEDANECDKAGVGFAAFAGQADRCEHVSGTCLKNQPLAYWRHDTEARESGRAGCYFLSNFAWVPSEAIKYKVNGTGSREFLALEHHSPHVSVIDVELTADYNALLRPGSSGRLTDVYADNTAIDYTVITVLITNKGSFPSSYRARITECPGGLPVSWLNAESPTKIISPHRDRKVTLDLYGRLSLSEFSCSVMLLNDEEEPVATRRIKIRKMDRCVCVRHCVCSCVTSGHRTTCQPMLLEHYHAAGFHGPIPTTPVEPSIWSNPITVASLFITALLLLLLLTGFLKWMIGLCVPAVGRWGLNALIETDKMNEYYESDLKSKSVIFDKFGVPVHPETGQNTVRVCNRKLEFFLNLMFFFLYPFAICCWSCSKPQQPSRQTSTVRSKTSLMSEKDESPSMICVSTYGDAINSKMEAEDTKYVIDELKKSQESLQNHSRHQKSQEDVNSTD